MADRHYLRCPCTLATSRIVGYTFRMFNSIKSQIRRSKLFPVLSRMRKSKILPHNALKSLIREVLEEAYFDDSYNISRAIQRQARDDSASWVLANIPLEKRFHDRYALMQACLKIAPSEGLILEFGVYKGNSVRFIGEKVAPRPVFGFDSFEGLDEPWIYEQPGSFNDVDTLPTVPSNVRLIKGWFNKTLPGFLTEQTGPIALLHIDSDLYSSAAYVLEAVQDRLRSGSVIVFDELFNFPQWRNVEFKAFGEWQERTGAKVEYVGFVSERGRDWSGHQVAVRIV